MKPTTSTTTLAPLGWTLRATMGVAVAITALLFAQWPLREWVQGGALLANDTAQALFALYVAVAVAWASARGAHLSVQAFDAAAPAGSAAPARWRGLGAALAPLPWCGWVLATGVRPAWQALAQTERFPDSGSPGYFLIKLAVPLLASLLAWQSLRQARALLAPGPRVGG